MSNAEYVFTAPDVWTPVPEAESQIYNMGDDGSDEAMTRAGYQPTIGHEHEIVIIGLLDIWRRADGEPGRQARYDYIVFMDLPGGEICTVNIPTIPDFFAFMRLYGGIAQAQLQNDYLQAAVMTLYKLFHAYHGHTYTTACLECDPAEYRHQQK
jgi:hypothetical protein